MISLTDVQRGYDNWAAQPHNKKWVKRLDGTPIANDIVVRIFDALKDAPASDIAALREENERLREALRPFSAEADHYRDSAGGVLIESGMGDVRDAEYNISDLRRARTLVHSALSQQEERAR